MIELYTWGTPNGRKIPIMLEEVGLPYVVKPVDIGRNEQFDPAYLKCGATIRMRIARQSG